MKTRSIGCALTAAASLLLAQAARAEPFTLLIYETPADIALRADAGAAGRDYWLAYEAFGRKLQAAGAIRGGAPLVSDDATTTQDGLVLGGYFLLDAPTLAEAEALAAAAPSGQRNGRAVLVMHAMPAAAMSAN